MMNTELEILVKIVDFPRLFQDKMILSEENSRGHYVVDNSLIANWKTFLETQELFSLMG
jgi:hypothetical protein